MAWSLSWRAYNKQMEAAVGCTEVEKATALILAFRGNALDILHTIPEQFYSTLCDKAINTLK